jgi:hypothetical protein
MWRFKHKHEYKEDELNSRRTAPAGWNGDGAMNFLHGKILYSQDISRIVSTITVLGHTYDNKVLFRGDPRHLVDTTKDSYGWGIWRRDLIFDESLSEPELEF